MPSDTITPWLQNARDFARMMIAEIPGHDAHPLIVAFFQFTQLHGTPAGESDETPWCSAFACACMELAGIQSPRHALAHSWLSWGQEISELRTGAVLVFERTNHVAFFNGSPDDTGPFVNALGGNQRNQVCSEFINKQRLISIRWVK